jgi:hypothetical protein
MVTKLKNITIITICSSITALSVSYFSIRSSCQQEAKVLARLEKVYSRNCKPKDKKCFRRAKRRAQSERSELCKYVK